MRDQRLFANWLDSPIEPPPSIDDFLSAEYHRLWSDSPVGREPAEADAVLAHGLPIALQLLGKDTKEKPSQLINLAAGNGATVLRRSEWLLAIKHIPPVSPNGSPRCKSTQDRIRTFALSALPGTLFHRVAECALRTGHPASWQSVLTQELDAAEWAQRLYYEVLGPDLTKSQSSLRESGAEVWQLWCAVRSFATWFCGLLAEATKRGLIAYDARRECWRGADTLFEQECDLIATLNRTGQLT